MNALFLYALGECDGEGELFCTKEKRCFQIRRELRLTKVVIS